MPIIDFDCKRENCPAFDTCAQLPTTFFDIDRKVDILFVGLYGDGIDVSKGRPFMGVSGTCIKTCILKAKGIWGKPFGVAFANVVRDGFKGMIGEQGKFCKEYLYRDIKRLIKNHGIQVMMPLSNTTRFFTNETEFHTIHNKSFGTIMCNPINNEKQITEDILESLKRIYL